MAILAFPVSDDAPPLPDVPPLVQYGLLRFFTPILAWLSEHIYQALLARCAAHPLVRLAQCYDPASVVATCATYYHGDGPGKPRPIPSIPWSAPRSSAPRPTPAPIQSWSATSPAI